MDFSGKVALVTGGSRGLGQEMALALAARGADVVITSRKADACEEVANKISAMGRQALAYGCHVGQWDALDGLVEAAYERFGKVDILINNAGIVNSGPIESFDEEAWDRIFEVNTKGIFLMTKAALSELRKSKSPSVINTASIAGKKGYANMSAYCGSKFAAIGITQSLANELAPDGIRVNAICPGMVGTAMWLEHLLPTNATDHPQKTQEFEEMMQERIPLGRPQTSEDMGHAALYLASANNVTGVSLSVSGGFEVN